MTRITRRLRHSPRLLMLLTGVVLVLVVVGVIVASLNDGGDPTATTGDQNTAVTRSGTRLMVGKQPLQLVGFNLYDAAATSAYSCAKTGPLSDGELTDLLRQAHRAAGATVLRFWAYQTYTKGGTDWSGVDRVLKIARLEGMRVLPVLEDGPGDCTYGPAGEPKDRVDGGNWYLSGYRAPFGGAPLSYRQYVERVVRHYAGNPTILGWTMMNEAETTGRDNTGRSQLVGFADDISRVIRSVDHRHLITVGTQGNGSPGSSGPDFAAVYGLPDVDFAEVHDYAFYGSDDEALPGGIGSDRSTLPPTGTGECLRRDAPIGCSMAIARAELKMPLIVGEAGIKATDSAGRTRRAEQFGRKIEAAFRGGASAYLIWQLNTINTDGYGVAPFGNDPLFPVLRRAAGQ